MTLTQQDITAIISQYDLRDVKDFMLLSGGAIQENILIETTKGAFVLKYYLNRSTRYVRFETELIRYLKDRGFACRKVYANREGELTGLLNGKPLALYEYIKGAPLEELMLRQKKTVIQKIAELHLLTASFETPLLKYRWNYSPAFCQKQALDVAKRIGTNRARRKLKWLTRELNRLQLPDALPRVICHADLHLTNLIFERGRLQALIDFDDANYTYYLWDIVNFVDYPKFLK